MARIEKKQLSRVKRLVTPKVQVQTVVPWLLKDFREAQCRIRICYGEHLLLTETKGANILIHDASSMCSR